MFYSNRLENISFDSINQNKFIYIFVSVTSLAARLFVMREMFNSLKHQKYFAHPLCSACLIFFRCKSSAFGGVKLQFWLFNVNTRMSLALPDHTILAFYCDLSASISY